MPTPSRYAFLIALVVLGALPGRSALAACDTTANALALADARDAIDAACPCAAAVKASDHVKCAKPVVATRVEQGMLDKSCKSEALNHAKKSICGRPGAVVCCRVKSNGKTAHKIAKEAGKCTSTATLTSCVSVFVSVPTGCDASGCIEPPPPVCGNYVIEAGETCEPPFAPVCDSNCQTVTCDRPVTSCGNGVLDGSEACEPPGVGTCGWDCQTATCTGSGPGEIDIACADDGATVGAGARGSEYLLAWNDLTYRPDPDIVARRFDADGGAVDATAKVVSQGVPCAGRESRPAVASNGDGYVVAWYGSGPQIGSTYSYYGAAYARPYDASATLGPLDELARRVPVGQCTLYLAGPTAVAPVPLAGSDVFAALWEDIAACLGIAYRDPEGVLLDYAANPPARTTIAIGYSAAGGPSPRPFSDGAASLATLGTDTLAVWHAHIEDTSPPYVSGHFVSGAWLAADGTTSSFTLSSREPGIGDFLQPAVAAASDKLLVAWAEGPVDDATDIRGMRVVPGGGGLDPDGGLLLATTAGGAVIGGPVVAFDGTVWLVAWTEVGVGGNDLRAVAVATDGTVLDATPRLLASGLGDAEPAIASAGDGRSLLVYVRPDGGKSAVRAQLVEGQSP